MYKRKSWREKLADSKDLPKVVKVDARMRQRWGGSTCAIPAPIDVDAIMKRVPKGKLATINEIRARVAADQKASFGCPITTGIFAWIAAHAAEESATDGAKRITPYWRTLKSGGELNSKYPGGIANLRKKLAAEGHKVVARGKRFFVQDYERAITKP